MYIFLFCMVLLTPAVVALIGCIWRKHPPASINLAYGYRTKRSMMNKETWTYAHKCCGTVWCRGGIILLLLSAAAMALLKNRDYETASMYIVSFQLVAVCLSIVPVESSIKKHFDEYGRRLW